MWKYENYNGTISELIADLQKDDFHLDFFPETLTEYGVFIATKERGFYKVEIAFERNRIVSIDSNIWVDEYEKDIPEYNDFDAIHDGSYLPD